MKNNPLIIYKTEDKKIKIETHFENETVWLNQSQIGELFQKAKATISEHIKNIFKEGELDRLYRMVTAFLEIAEIQVLDRNPMYMSDWIKQLDTFLKMTNKDILQHSGTISHQQSIKKAHSEYEIYKKKISNKITQVEKDFIKQIESKTKNLKK